ncbi:spermatogenesis-associated protein 1 [Narcine bancroftii]|uniref:spermatogenesis-associated protein 1 n=1 Tax=Narcine bancroftii TaxID=1343680 RepID=UPI003831B1DF
MELDAMRSAGSRRALSSAALELHVFCVPSELWDNTLNTVSTHVISKFISVGFVRVLPDLSLRALRLQIGNLLGADRVDDKFAFLKCVGRSLAVVRPNQELELKVKAFAPPCAPQPELYLLPGMGIGGKRTLAPGAQPRPEGRAESCELQSFVSSDRIVSSVGCQSCGSPCLGKGQGRRPARTAGRRPPNSSPEDDATRVQGAGTFLCAGFPEQAAAALPSNRGPLSVNSGNEDLRGSDVCRVSCRTESPGPLPVREQKPSLGTNTRRPQLKMARSEQDEHLWRKSDASCAGDGCLVIQSQSKETRIHSNNTMDSGRPESLEERDLEHLENQRKKSQQVRQDPKSRTSRQETSQMPDGNRRADNPPNMRLHSLPPSPPPLAVSADRPQFPTDREEFIAQINAVKQERKCLAKSREELVKTTRALLSQNRLRQNQARNNWKKRYFNSKKATGLLEETSRKLWQELETCHLKRLHQLAARESRDRRGKSASASHSKNELIVQITSLKHEIDQLYHRLESAQMKLVIEIKLRKQMLTDVRALRAELAQKKAQSSLARWVSGFAAHGLNIAAA